MLVMDRKMSSLKYIEFVRKNLPLESVEQILSVGLMNLSTPDIELHTPRAG